MRPIRRRPRPAWGIVVFAFGAVAAAESDLHSIDFDTYPDKAPVLASDSLSDQWSSVGVLFSAPGNQPLYALADPCARSLPNDLDVPAVTLTFIDPATGGPGVISTFTVGQDWCWAPGDHIALTAYDAAGNLIVQQTASGPGFLTTIETSCPRIARIEIGCFGQAIDDLVLDTPTGLRSADLDGSGGIDAGDLALLMDAWGPGDCDSSADLDRSGSIDARDLTILLGDWS